MNNSGSGSSTIISRHDYQPFGKEIGATIGLRTTTQKYSTTDRARQRFALTERDEASGLDHTWFRKYENSAGRWTSPDPLSGSISDPQSFNQYSYTTNDPVNLVDPSGLMPCLPGDISPQCDSSGFSGWGWGDLGNRDRRTGLATILAREEAFDRSLRSQSRYYSRWLEGSPPPWASDFLGSPWFGYDPQDPDTGLHPDACGAMAQQAQTIANQAIRSSGGDLRAALRDFDNSFARLYAGHPLRTRADASDFLNGANTANAFGLLGESGFDPKFQEGNVRNDQTHHFVTYFSGALNNMGSYLAIHKNLFEDQPADVRLGDAAENFGDAVRNDPGYLRHIGHHIQIRICDNQNRSVPQFVP